ncbi:MAG: hypothetical protein J7L21_02200, partial [Sulfurimonas sp.]|nr:hypothetical protein [Sulfurimonas sp.]
MKKVFLSVLLFLFPLYLFGNSIDEEYMDGLDAYKAKDFQSSYAVFSKLYLKKLSDARINFYLGRSALETGRYEVALAAFERVEMLGVASLRSKFEMARAYLMLKMYKDSELAFEEVLSNPDLSKNLRVNAELYLSKVKKVQKKSFTHVSVNLDWVYDSNVNYGSLGGKYDTDIGTYPSSELSDRAIQLYAGITNVYDIGDKGGFAIKNIINLLTKDYQELDSYDIQFLSYTPSLLYKETAYVAELVVGVDIMTLGKREYLRTVSISPRF